MPPKDIEPPVAAGLAFSGKALKKLLGSKGAPFKFNMSEAGAFQIELLADGKIAKGLGAKSGKLVVIAKAAKSGAGAGVQKITFKLSKKAQRKLAKLRKLKVTVRITMTDLAQNKSKPSGKAFTLKK